MLNFIRSLFTSKRTQNDIGCIVPYGVGNNEYNFRLPGRVWHTEQALTLSPFWNALRLYQQTAASLPLVAYQKDADGGRHRLQDKATYNILHERPNPAQSRAVFMEQLLHDYWLQGEFFVRIQWANNHRLLALYPVPARSVEKIDFDDAWNKTYHVNGEDEPLQDDEMIHVINFSIDGLRGVSFLRYAGESLGLHKQILDTATMLYENMPRVTGVVKQTSAINNNAKENLKESLKEYQGPSQAGKTMFVPLGTDYSQLDTKSAEAAQIIEALNLSTMSIAQWFGLSPLVLGDLSRGTYSNSAADKLAFYQKNMLPILAKIEQEFNYKLFTSTSDVYAEFLLDNLLRADPLTQAQVWNSGLQAGYYLKSEVREWLNLPPVPGMDVATQPLNMGPVASQEQQPPDAQQETTPNE